MTPRDGDQGQLARRDPLERRAILPVGVHKAQALLQRDELGHISAREALMWKVRRPGGGFAAFRTVCALAIDPVEPAGRPTRPDGPRLFRLRLPFHRSRTPDPGTPT